jgi:hypothetical protein
MLDRLKAMVLEDNRVMTYKSVSAELGVHVNRAKQLLFALTEQQSSPGTGSADLDVLYLVAGRPKSAGGQTYVRVTRRLDDDTSGLLESVTSRHVYAVSSGNRKADEASVFTADIKAGSAASQHAAIANKKAVPRPEIPPQPGRVSEPTMTEDLSDDGDWLIASIKTDTREAAASQHAAIANKKAVPRPESQVPPQPGRVSEPTMPEEFSDDGDWLIASIDTDTREASGNEGGMTPDQAARAEKNRLKAVALKKSRLGQSHDAKNIMEDEDKKDKEDMEDEDAALMVDPDRPFEVIRVTCPIITEPF